MLLSAAALAARARTRHLRAYAIAMAVLTTALALAGAPDALAAGKPVLSAKDVVAKEATGAADVNFALARPARTQVRFTVIPIRGTAQRADASFALRHVVIRRGRRSAVVRIPLRNDALNENTEHFFVTVSAGARLKSGRRVRITIRDNDPMPRVSVADAAPADEVTTAALVFMISLSSPSGRPVTVRYQTDAGPDAETAGSVTLTPGAAKPRPMTVRVNNDFIDEDDQLVTLTLSSPDGAVIADGTATGLIRDNDPPPRVDLSAASSIVEGDEGSQSIDLTVSLRGATQKPVTVTLATRDGFGDPNELADRIATGSAIDEGGGDYESFSDRIISFAPGQTTATTSVLVFGDTEYERTEHFRVIATSATNATADDVERFYISNNDIQQPDEP